VQCKSSWCWLGFNKILFLLLSAVVWNWNMLNIIMVFLFIPIFPAASITMPICLHKSFVCYPSWKSKSQHGICKIRNSLEPKHTHRTPHILLGNPKPEPEPNTYRITLRMCDVAVLKRAQQMGIKWRSNIVKAIVTNEVNSLAWSGFLLIF